MPVLGTFVLAVCLLSGLAPASEQVELTSPPSCVTLDELLHISESQFLPLQKCPLIPSLQVDAKNYQKIKTQKSVAQPLAQIPVTSGDGKERLFSGCLVHRTCEFTLGPLGLSLP